jgi:hypothetical protein
MMLRRLFISQYISKLSRSSTYIPLHGFPNCTTPTTHSTRRIISPTYDFNYLSYKRCLLRLLSFHSASSYLLPVDAAPTCRARATVLCIHKSLAFLAQVRYPDIPSFFTSYRTYHTTPDTATATNLCHHRFHPTDGYQYFPHLV